jgi:hypothetical protein
MPEHEARRRAVYDHADDEPRPASRGRRQIADWGVGEELFDGMPGSRFDRRGDDHTYARTEPDDPTQRAGGDRKTPRAGGDRTISRSDSIARGGAGDGRRTIVITEDDVRFVDEAPAEEFASRADALRARRRHDEIWAGNEPFADDEPFAEARDEPSGRAFAAAAEAFEAGGRFAERPSAAPDRSEPEDNVRGGASRRRTVPEPEGNVRGGLAGRRTVPEPEDTLRGGLAGRRTVPEPERIVRGGVEGRRTVKIGGRPAEFHPAPGRRRPSRTMHERLGPQPDRIAAWAFALGILLILIAIATANV